MNGPEHYTEAGRLLDQAADLRRARRIEEGSACAFEAAVHARLAAVAVQALSADGQLPDEDFAAWDEVAGVPAAQDLPAPRPVPRTLVDTSDDPPPPR